MITPHVRGQVLHDIYSGNGRLYLRMKNGKTVRCAWGDHGPELIDVVQLLPPTDQALEARFQYVSGKTIRNILTDGEKMLIAFTDGAPEARPRGRCRACTHQGACAAAAVR